MNSGRLGGASSRRLATLFLAVVVPPAVALVWLGVQLLEQDRSLLAQRQLERGQAAAQLAASTLEKSLARAERWLAEDDIPEHVVRLTASRRGVQAFPRARVLWLPDPPAMPAAVTRVFAEAERLEYQGSPAGALAAYRALAQSASSTVRAGALLRVARVHRREGRTDQALAGYRDLSTIDEVAIDGMPVDLLARRAVCDVLDEAGRRAELESEAGALTTDLLAGRWALDRAAWELTATDLERWTGKAIEHSPERAVLSAVSDWLSGELQRWASQDQIPAARRMILVEDTPVTLIIRQDTAGELTALRHVTELLDESDEVPPERRRAFYDVLGRNTERLQRLVESLLDFARMEDGRKPYDLKPVNLATLTEQVVAEFRQDAGAEGVTIEFDAQQAATVQSLADAASLTHALWNLLDNAVKYSPDRHAIRVSVERHPTGVAISVRDAGLGVPRREQKDIFGKFVRGQQVGQLGIKGTGLGLAMVDHIARAHGGAVELESEEGVGSTFRLVLPAMT